MHRRGFLRNIPLLTAIPFIGRTQLFEEIQKDNNAFFNSLEQFDRKDEAYWNEIKKSYATPHEFIDLNSAGLSAITTEVEELLQKSIGQLYEIPSKRISNFARLYESMKDQFSLLTGCGSNELVIQRNATEALETAIFGIPLKKGDEVVVGLYDYPHIFYAWKQRADREGIVLKYVDIGPNPSSSEYIVDKYLEQVGPKTRAIQITDLINYTGCQIPTQSIIEQLPRHVRFRIVDAAQSFANTRDDWASIGATHIGASLHKWLGAPIGTGLLYVNEEFIGETWPLFASHSGREKSINKFSHLGSRNTALFPAVLLALQFHNLVGQQTKQERLLYLAKYFVKKAETVDSLKIVSSTHPDLMTNLVVFKIKDIGTLDMHHRLWKHHKIHVTNSIYEGVDGTRISPNVFTSKEEIDQLVDALKQMT